jgi:hypothetical protein
VATGAEELLVGLLAPTWAVIAGTRAAISTIAAKHHRNQQFMSILSKPR